jgi:hypothetical protein
VAKGDGQRAVCLMRRDNNKQRVARRPSFGWRATIPLRERLQSDHKCSRQ